MPPCCRCSPSVSFPKTWRDCGLFNSTPCKQQLFGGETFKKKSHIFDVKVRLTQRTVHALCSGAVASGGGGYLIGVSDLLLGIRWGFNLSPLPVWMPPSTRRLLLLTCLPSVSPAGSVLKRRGCVFIQSISCPESVVAPRPEGVHIAGVYPQRVNHCRFVCVRFQVILVGGSSLLAGGWALCVFFRHLLLELSGDITK